MKKSHKQILKKVIIIVYLIISIQLIDLLINLNTQHNKKDEQSKYSNIYPEISAYLDFIKKNKEHQKPISELYLEKQVKNARQYFLANLPGKISDNLKETIIQELNIGFLLEELSEAELIVTIKKTLEYEYYTEKELLFTNSQVGNFSAMLLIPNKQKESYPAIVGLHGHGSNKEEMKIYYFGETLVKEGFVVIMPDFRAMNADLEEIVISEELYLNGFNLMGLRIYETLLLIEYLKKQNFVDEDNIGIIGHSGGSMVAYLTSIISLELQAIVYDYKPGFLNLLSETEIHCQTNVELSYYQQQINSNSTLKIPSQEFNYGYTNMHSEQKVISFFKKYLQNITEKNASIS